MQREKDRKVGAKQLFHPMATQQERKKILMNHGTGPQQCVSLLELGILLIETLQSLW